MFSLLLKSRTSTWSWELSIITILTLVSHKKLMENNQISFLDALITVKSNFSFGFSVWRKKTHTDRYLHFTSNHPMHQKISVIDSLVTRALRICDADQLNAELDHITTALKNNGYPIQSIHSRIEFHRSNQTTPNRTGDEFTKRIILPYTGRMTSQIARIIRNSTNLEVAFRPPIKSLHGQQTINSEKPTR